MKMDEVVPLFTEIPSAKVFSKTRMQLCETLCVRTRGGFFEHCAYSLQSERLWRLLRVRYRRYERPDDPRIELGTGVALNLFQGLCRRDAPSIAPALGHRIERVGHLHYTCGERCPLTAQPVRVTAPVVALVMVLHRRKRRWGYPYALKGPAPRDGVQGYNLTLLRCQGTRLLENGVGHEDLAYVVQQGPDEQRSHLAYGEPHLEPNELGEAGDRSRVLPGMGVPSVHGFKEDWHGPSGNTDVAPGKVPEKVVGYFEEVAPHELVY
jgi:hypothetical protein